MEKLKDYVSWKTGKRMNRSGINLSLTSLEIMVKMEGKKVLGRLVGILHKIPKERVPFQLSDGLLGHIIMFGIMSSETPQRFQMCEEH